MRLLIGLTAALLLTAYAHAIPGVTIPFPEDVDAEDAAAQAAEDDADSVTAAPAALVDMRATTAGPHLNAADYPRGNYEEGDVSRLVWSVRREDMDGTPLEGIQERIIVLGPDFAHDTGGDLPVLYDFAHSRRLTLDLDARTMRNDSFYGDVRQRLDTYLGLSQGGTLADIPYGPDRTFERFWLEAAMGMRRQAVPLQVRTQDGLTQVNRDGVTIFAFVSDRPDTDDVVLDLDAAADDAAPIDTDEAASDDAPLEEDTSEPSDPLLDLLRADSADDVETEEPEAADAAPADVTPTGEETDGPVVSQHADLFRRWMRHALPLHPDALSAMDGLDIIPTRFELVIVSPVSPEGRREIWTLEQVEAAAAAFPLPDDLTPTYPGPESLSAQVVPAVVDELALDSETDHSAALLEEAEAYRAAGNLPAAYLDSAHAGACSPRTTGRPSCEATSNIVATGLGNAEFEAFFEGIAAIATGDYARAFGGVEPYLDLGGYAGAAANTIAANELVAWAASGGEPPEARDPFDLLVTAIENDPGAPATYWHLGQALITTGERNAGWDVYDLGRIIDRPPGHPLLQQSYILEDRLRALAPDFFAPR